jgi:hypothetical protein
MSDPVVATVTSYDHGTHGRRSGVLRRMPGSSVLALAAARKDHRKHGKREDEESLHSGKYGRLAAAVLCSFLVSIGLIAGAAAASSPRVVTKIITGDNPCAVAAGFGSLWDANDGGGTLVRIDPERNRITNRIRIAKGICPLAVAGGAVWVAGYLTNMGWLVRFDARSGRMTSAYKVGGNPSGLAFARRPRTATRCGSIRLPDASSRRFRFRNAGRRSERSRRRRLGCREGPGQRDADRPVGEPHPRRDLGRKRRLLHRSGSRRHVDHELRRE